MYQAIDAILNQVGPEVMRPLVYIESSIFSMFFFPT